MNKVTKLPNTEERCEICKKRKHEKLCDFVVDEFWTSIDFQTRAYTCDAKLCTECAVHLGGQTHFCPKHVEMAKKKLRS